VTASGGSTQGRSPSHSRLTGRQADAAYRASVLSAADRFAAKLAELADKGFQRDSPRVLRYRRSGIFVRLRPGTRLCVMRHVER
jgi:hypothetical protein